MTMYPRPVRVTGRPSLTHPEKQSLPTPRDFFNSPDEYTALA
jgi:hypothetical protein